MKSMVTIVKEAEEKGFNPVKTQKGGLKCFGCKKCRKNTGVKFVNEETKEEVIACQCGWRQKLN